MQTLLVTLVVLGLVTVRASGQGAQADQIKRRARDVANQNNTGQGVAPPAQPGTVPGPTAANASATNPASTPQQNIARIQATLAGFKPGVTVAPAQKQQLIKDIAVACRGTKPSLPTVTTFVNGLTAALTEATLETAQQKSLAQGIEAVVNSAPMGSSQFEAIIADMKAILQASGAKQSLAVAASHNLKAVGLEVRRRPAQ